MFIECEGKKIMTRKLSTYVFILLFSFAVMGVVRRQVEVIAKNCVGCTDCIEVCPKEGAIKMSRGKAVIDPEYCIGCRKCVYICSFNAIRSWEND